MSAFGRAGRDWQWWPARGRRVAMTIASRKRPGEPVGAHTDNGPQYTSPEYTELLRDAGIAPSRGGRHPCSTNAMAESVIADQDRVQKRRPLADMVRSRNRAARRL